LLLSFLGGGLFSLPAMQVITKVRCRPEQYCEQQLHFQVRPPIHCPHCTKRERLEVLGYYERNVTDTAGQVRRIQVRRFLCTHCQRTVSCLPDFAQPYRLLHNHTIQQFFNGATATPAVQRWLELLPRYWRRFTGWAPQLRRLLGSVFGRAPPKEKVEALWRRLLAACRNLSQLTGHLVQNFRTTCFGSYRCHQPQPAR
jgi:hypothetical protein